MRSHGSHTVHTAVNKVTSSVALRKTGSTGIPGRLPYGSHAAHAALVWLPLHEASIRHVWLPYFATRLPLAPYGSHTAPSQRTRLPYGACGSHMAPSAPIWRHFPHGSDKAYTAPTWLRYGSHTAHTAPVRSMRLPYGSHFACAHRSRNRRPNSKSTKCG
jgi:hypothetical protein